MINSAYAQLEQITMHYLDTKTDGQTILCIHGLWGRADTWRNFMKVYSKNFRVIAMDLRGHGYSDQPDTPYTVDVMSDDISQLMTYLGIEKAIVLGHSMGGKIAAYLSLNYPEKVSKLAILDKGPTGIDPNIEIDQSKRYEDMLTKDWPLPFADLETARTFIFDAVEDALSFSYFMLSLTEVKNGYDMLFSKSAIGSIKANDHSWFHILPEIKCPVLIARTSSNQFLGDDVWHKMQTLLKNSYAVDMSHPNHNVHLANPEEFYEIINHFIVTR